MIQSYKPVDYLACAMSCPDQPHIMPMCMPMRRWWRVLKQVHVQVDLFCSAVGLSNFHAFSNFLKFLSKHINCWECLYWLASTNLSTPVLAPVHKGHTCRCWMRPPSGHYGVVWSRNIGSMGFHWKIRVVGFQLNWCILGSQKLFQYVVYFFMENVILFWECIWF